MISKLNTLYIVILAVVFAAIAIVFDTFPRSTVSELEKRELATFPDFSSERLFSGQFTSDVSKWFSDSEPYRDELMALSMNVKDWIRLSTDDEEQITFHAADPAEQQVDEGAEREPTEQERAEGVVPEELADENAKIAHAGIVVVGTGEKVRALMAFGAGPKASTPYAELANKYKETFPTVNVYCMAVPLSIEFYCPEKVKKASKPQRPVIDNLIENLVPGVKAVDVYWTLKEHALEDIYLRTDHHWSPLGAFYAAKKFAQVAGVPFRDLDAYEQQVVHGYVGSMYGYSKDVAVKNAPEDFVYYMPTQVSYETTYTNYNVNGNYQVTSEGRPYTGPFFYKFKDGSGGAYCTFMGSDMKLTQVRTATKNGRRLIIIKDSYGNALPGYLFYSFEEVHVIDSRYFKKNLVDYVSDNQITDILFAFNMYNACSRGIANKCLKFLTQNGAMDRPTPTQPADSTKAEAPQPATEAPAAEEPQPTVEEPAVAEPEAPAAPAEATPTTPQAEE